VGKTERLNLKSEQNLPVKLIINNTFAPIKLRSSQMCSKSQYKRLIWSF